MLQPRTATLAALLVAAGQAAAAPAVNGTDLNGTDLNGVELDTGELGGVHVGLRLEGSMLVATLPSGDTLTGDDLVGGRLRGVTLGGEAVVVRLDAFALTGDVGLYTMSYRSRELGSGWQPACPGGAPAVALAGAWLPDGSKHRDPGVLTLACPGGALRKCVELGYAPWRERSGTSLDPAHQACTRAIRADYCGTGSAYTQNGHPIDIYDRLGLQADTEDWTPEAEWGEDGAACLSGAATRATVPVTCEAERLDAACGQDGHEAPGALLVTELPAAEEPAELPITGLP